MFDEAAWDALLALYVDEQGGLTVSAGSLAEQVGIRLHIMMRWIAYLEGHGLVVRGTDALQGRSGLIRLSDKGRSDLERYFADTLVMAAQ
jgi:DNA-binding MarR family transcriptional regulator